MINFIWFFISLTVLIIPVFVIGIVGYKKIMKAIKEKNKNKKVKDK